MSTPEITTILGPGSAFEGKLTFEGAVRIDGDFKGEIRTEGTLIVGETANVRAQIVGAHVVVHGTVHGDIEAREGVEIRSPAQIHGNVTTPSLEIEKGARFDGTCRMEGDPPRTSDSIEPPAEPEEPASDPDDASDD